MDLRATIGYEDLEQLSFEDILDKISKDLFNCSLSEAHSFTICINCKEYIDVNIFAECFQGVYTQNIDSKHWETTGLCPKCYVAVAKKVT
tara:strand:- start:234 stop:503 length:270 start_codon:yes stop_codon:yes gene_type:complete